MKEQATFNEEQNQWTAKGDREISSKSLQSAHDGEATYRNKSGKKHVGYALNLLETCANENPVQIVTHYEVAPNTTSDVEMLSGSLPNAAELGVKDLYTDGGYYSPKIVEEAEVKGITMHYTDMTGRKTSSDKLPYSSFTIEDKEKIVLCPVNQSPLRTNFNEKSGILSAHFQLEICNKCPQKENCRIKFQKKDTVLYVSQKVLNTEETRMKITNHEERKESTSKRAAIEGTNSALKRAHSAGKLNVRGIVKCELVLGAKIIAHNFRQIARFFKGEIRKKAKLSTFNQGIPVSIC
ncbi:MAG: transposase [Desulfosporosinus fructosivorans]